MDELSHLISAYVADGCKVTLSLCEGEGWLRVYSPSPEVGVQIIPLGECAGDMRQYVACGAEVQYAL